MIINLKNIKLKINEEFDLINLENNLIIDDIYLNGKRIKLDLFKVFLNDVLEFDYVQLERIKILTTKYVNILHITSKKQLEYLDANDMINSYTEKNIIKYKLNGKEYEIIIFFKVNLKTKKAKIFELINSILKENNFDFKITSDYSYLILKDLINDEELRKLFQKSKRKEKFDNILNDAGIK